MHLHCKYFYPFHFTLSVRSFIEITKLAFTVPGVKAFLSERFSQDPLEKFFGCQRQRGGTSENPNVSEFCKNTQALRVINSVCGDVSQGNCRGNKLSRNLMWMVAAVDVCEQCVCEQSAPTCGRVFSSSAQNT